jgi:hypothetical protein
MADDDFEDIEDLEDFDDLDEEEEERAKPKAKSKGKAEKKPAGIGASAVAAKLGCEPKTFRAWLRRKVDAGDFPDLKNREKRSRYSWANWKDPGLLEVMKAWKDDDHTKGGGPKKAKETAAKRKKAPAKKAPAKRRATKK